MADTSRSKERRSSFNPDAPTFQPTGQSPPTVVFAAKSPAQASPQTPLLSGDNQRATAFSSELPISMGPLPPGFTAVPWPTDTPLVNFTLGALGAPAELAFQGSALSSGLHSQGGMTTQPSQSASMFSSPASKAKVDNLLLSLSKTEAHLSEANKLMSDQGIETTANDLTGIVSTDPPDVRIHKLMLRLTKAESDLQEANKLLKNRRTEPAPTRPGPSKAGGFESGLAHALCHQKADIASTPVRGTSNHPQSGALTLWNQAERDVAARDPRGWAALAREDLNQVRQLYYPGFVPEDILQTHMDKYADVYPNHSQAKPSSIENATPAVNHALPGNLAKLTHAATAGIEAMQTTRPRNKSIYDVTESGVSLTHSSGDSGTPIMAPAESSTPVSNRRHSEPQLMPSPQMQYSPGPAFPALGSKTPQVASRNTGAGRKLADTIEIPYPGGPVTHKPYRTIPRQQQTGSHLPSNNPIGLDAFVVTRPNRLGASSRRATRPKRLDQGPLPSEADIYPDDSEHYGSPEDVQQSRFEKNADNMNLSNLDFKSMFRSGQDTASFDVEQDTHNFGNLGMEDSAPGQSSQSVPSLLPAFEPGPSRQTNSMTTAPFVPQPSREHQIGLHTIQEETDPDPFPTYLPIGQQLIALTSGEGADESNIEPDSITDLQFLSPVPTNASTLGRGNTPRAHHTAAPRAGAGSGPGAQEYGTRRKPRAAEPNMCGMEPDQLDGSRYGLRYGGLGMHRLGDVWMPPKPKQGTRFSGLEYLWGQ